MYAKKRKEKKREEKKRKIYLILKSIACCWKKFRIETEKSLPVSRMRKVIRNLWKSVWREIGGKNRIEKFIKKNKTFLNIIEYNKLSKDTKQSPIKE